MEVPDDIDIESARSNYNNGVLAITNNIQKERTTKTKRQTN